MPYYRPYCYVNFFQMDDSNVRVKGRGGACSGTNWFANYFAGKQMNLPSHSSQTLYDAAVQLYNGVLLRALEELGWCGRLFCGKSCQEDGQPGRQHLRFRQGDDTKRLLAYQAQRTGWLSATSVNPSPDNLLMTNIESGRLCPRGSDRQLVILRAVEGLMFIDGYYQ